MTGDVVIAHIARTCAQFQAVKKVVLFGSRAVSQSHSTSDYDIGVWWDLQSKESYGRFCEIIREESPMLNSFDIVRVDLASRAMMQSIIKEGITIYEQASPIV